MTWAKYLPFRDLKGYTRQDAQKDLTAALTVVFTGVPQGIAYAMIAELPPVTGLYASIFPAIIGSFFRSSRHVVAGPSNALSLLVGGALIAQSGIADPVTVAITLAFMVGLFQILAGVMGLAVIVDFVSQSVVRGYITGAGILIGVGQLHNLTATDGARGNIAYRIAAWVQSAAHADGVTVAVGLGTAALILLIRRLKPSWPGAILALAGATAVSWLMNLHAGGLKVVADLSPIDGALPPFTLPDLSLVPSLLPVAGAATVLSLIESSSVARGIATRTRQRLDSAAEFLGQGLANLAAAFSGGYPVSGSLSRSALNERAGAVSRLAGVMGGFLMLATLWLLGPVFNHTPIAALAGLLIVVSYDLINTKRIRFILRSGWPDRIAFAATAIGTWTLELDQAIYVGVGLSLVFLLRQARLLVSKELAVGPGGHLREVGEDAQDWQPRRCEHIRVLNLEGRLFFGVEGELRSALDEVSSDPEVDVVIVRMKRTQGLDATVAGVFLEHGAQMASEKRHLILVGLRPSVMQLFRRTGIASSLGEDHLYPTQPRWFGAMHDAVETALRLARPHDLEACPLHQVLKDTAHSSPQQTAPV